MLTDREPVFGCGSLSAALYTQASGPEDLVPLADVLTEIQGDQGERAAQNFYKLFVKSAFDGLFDHTDLHFFALGELIPFDKPASKFLKARGKIYGSDQAQADYIDNCCIRLGMLRDWSDQRGRRLPARLCRSASADVRRQPREQNDENQPAKQPPIGISKKGRPSHPYWDQLIAEANRMVDKGEQASTDDRTHTQKKMARDLRVWAAKNMPDPLKEATILKYCVKLNWRAWQSPDWRRP